MLVDLFGNSGFCTFLGALVGALASVGAVYLGNACELKAKRKERIACRAEDIRRAQVDELSVLGELVLKWGRETYVYYSSIIGELKAPSNSSGRALGNSDADNSLRILSQDICLHGGRLLDDSLREALRGLTSDVCLSNDANEVEKFLDAKLYEYSSVLEMVAAHRRNLITADAETLFEIGS